MKKTQNRESKIKINCFIYLIINVQVNFLAALNSDKMLSKIFFDVVHSEKSSPDNFRTIISPNVEGYGFPSKISIRFTLSLSLTLIPWFLPKFINMFLLSNILRIFPVNGKFFLK